MTTALEALREAIPSKAARVALATGPALAVPVWSDTVRSLLLQHLSPVFDREWLAQCVLFLALLLASSCVALLFVVLESRRIQREHAAELTRLATNQPAAAAQAIGLVTRTSRRMISRGLDDDPRL